MLWVFVLHSTIWTGFELISLFLPNRFDTLDQVAIGIPFGVAVVSWIFFILRMFKSVNKTTVISVTLFLYFFSLLLHLIRPRAIKYRKIKWYSVLFFIMYMFLICTCFHKAVFYNGSLSAGTVYSDLPVHYSLVTSFAYGVNSGTSKFLTPFYSEAKLCYPFLPDFYSSILVISGCSLRVCIVLPSILMFVSLFIGLHRVGLLFSDAILVPELTILFFLFAGGTGWKYLFNLRCRKFSGTNATHQLCDKTYVFWINCFLHFLLPQRSGLFSISLDIYIILLVIHFWETKFNDILAAFLAGMLMGFIPMISAHSYIAVGEYAIFLCILSFPWPQPKKWLSVIKKWAVFGCVSIFLAAPQIYELLSGHRSQMMSINPVWNEGSETRRFKAIHVWWESLSTFVVIALFLVWFTLNSRQKTIYFQTIPIFIISNFLRYQPGAMDNTKVFFPGWMVLASAAVAHFLVTISRISVKQKKYFVIPAVVLVTACFLASSCYGIFNFMKYEYTLANENDREFGQWVIENTDKTSVFLGSWWHSSAPMMIGGRQITMGYPGWVWTHGLNQKEREKLMNEMGANLNNISLFDSHNVKYIMRRKDDASKNFFLTKPDLKSRWMKILTLGNTKLYRIIKI